MLEELMLKKKIWAVIGVNQEKDRYGNMIFERLKQKDYQVYPINPKYTYIGNDVCYPSLSSLPQKPEVVNMVVGPEKAKLILKEASDLGIKYIWFQPGTYNDEVLELTKKLSLEYVLACVLVATLY